MGGNLGSIGLFCNNSSLSGGGGSALVLSSSHTHIHCFLMPCAASCVCFSVNKNLSALPSEMGW